VTRSGIARRRWGVIPSSGGPQQFRKIGFSSDEEAGSHRLKRFGKAINYRAVQPPSMSKVCPVMSDAAGEARKTTAPATSMGSPIR
jgi:hypothetical protein